MLSGLAPLLLLAAWFFINWRETRRVWTAGSGDAYNRVMKLMPELSTSIGAIRDALPAGNAGQMAEIQEISARFCMLAYRYIGRDHNKISAADSAAASENLQVIRADLVNAIQALYNVTNRESQRSAIDVATREVLESTRGYMEMAIDNMSAAGAIPKNIYDSSRIGVPRPFCAESGEGAGTYDVML